MSVSLAWLDGSVRRRTAIVVALAAVTGALRVGGVASVPDAVFALMGVFLAVTAALALGGRTCATDAARFRVYAVVLCVDAACVGAAYATVDGARWLGVSLFALLVMFAGAALPGRHARRVAAACSAAFAASVWAEPFGLAARHSPFSPGDPRAYAVATSVMGAMVLAIVLGLQRGLVRLVRRSEGRHRVVLETVPDVVAVFDAGGCLVEVNAAGAVRLGATAREIVGRPLAAFAAPEDRDTAAAHATAALGGTSSTFELRLAGPGGAAWWGACTCTPLRGTPPPSAGSAGDVVAGFVAVVRDQTAERAAADAVRRSEARYRSLVEASAQAVWTTDARGRVVDPVPRLAAFTGRAAAELVGIGYLRNVHPDDRPRVAAAFRTARATRAPFEVEHRLRRRDGAWRDTVARGVPILGPDGAVREWVGTHTDVTERKALEAALAHRADHDPLTGLANRTRFRERAAAALARAAGGSDAGGSAVCEARGGVAVLFIDLDDFKAVNDGAGHAAGDALLVVVAERLLNATRGSDTVARLGGDEFAVLLAGVTDVAQVVVVAARILAALARPARVVGTVARVGASVGVALARPGDGVDEVLQHADAAMYRAKRDGKGAYAVFGSPTEAEACERRAPREEPGRTVPTPGSGAAHDAAPAPGTRTHGGAHLQAATVPAEGDTWRT